MIALVLALRNEDIRAKKWGARIFLFYASIKDSVLLNSLMEFILAVRALAAL